MDVALASVIASGTIGLSGVFASIWAATRPGKVTREARLQQRLADAYLEVLRIVEREAQWLEAEIYNLSLTYEDVHYVEAKLIQLPIPEPTDRVTAAALLDAFSSTTIRDRYREWRETVDAASREIHFISRERRNNLQAHADPKSLELNELSNQLAPREYQLRQSLVNAIALELKSPGRHE
ncbi:hypothetical protein BKA01_002439 [Pseudonocardia eucalypti]|uniref:hypothetical protein n=1 Tax=Pseudonocardia eucalypti TaxID=648755 RepID=UPI0016177672|nr:hypothetical protein [Pseudonocardia eucalypti]